MNAAGQLGTCLISNTVSSYSASFGKRRWQVDTIKPSSTYLNKRGTSFCPVLYVYNLITSKCAPVLFESDLGHFHMYFLYPVHGRATAANVKSELMCFFLHHSFSTAYQCIYYSPEHTAKAQEVLSTMSLLQPLITSLADQLLQAAQEHSSPGLRDALKNLSDKVRQPPNPPHFHLYFPFIPLGLELLQPSLLFLDTSLNIVRQYLSLKSLLN